MFSSNDVLVAAGEVQRQQASPMHVHYLLKALSVARTAKIVTDVPDMQDLIHWASLVNNKVMDLRNTPVTFANFGGSVHPENIVRTLEYLLIAIEDGTVTPEQATREFLYIHPFEDGNGRVGWLLYNFLNRTLEDLVPLPYFGW